MKLPPLGKHQQSLLAFMRAQRRDWHAYSRWSYGGRLRTAILLEALSRRGLVVKCRIKHRGQEVLQYMVA